VKTPQSRVRVDLPQMASAPRPVSRVSEERGSNAERTVVVQAVAGSSPVAHLQQSVALGNAPRGWQLRARKEYIEGRTG
jgi:hypothetical protein